jgi:hypothetical protein
VVTEYVEKATYERNYTVDPSTAEGIWNVLKRRYGKRTTDAPIWFLALYHLFRPLIVIAPWIIAALAVKWLGVPVPLPGAGP